MFWSSSNLWPLAWMVSLTDHSLELWNIPPWAGRALLQRTLGWSHHKVLYSTLYIYYYSLLKARTNFWLVHFLYVGRFSPYLKAPANIKNQEIYISLRVFIASSKYSYFCVIIVVNNLCKSELYSYLILLLLILVIIIKTLCNL